VLELEKSGGKGHTEVEGAKLKIESKKGMLVLWKSRFVKYSVSGQSPEQKEFFVQFWVNGP
jgi:hypothetical protein